MNSIKNAKTAISEIGMKLIQDTKLLKYLINDSSTPLLVNLPPEASDVNYLIQNNYITYFPIIETAIVDKGRNTFLVLVLNSIDERGVKNINVDMSIFIVTNHDHFLLADGSNRLLEISDRICADLDSLKISNAGTLDVSGIETQILDTQRIAYRIDVSCADQSPLEDGFIPVTKLGDAELDEPNEPSTPTPFSPNGYFSSHKF